LIPESLPPPPLDVSEVSAPIVPPDDLDAMYAGLPAAVRVRRWIAKANERYAR